MKILFFGSSDYCIPILKSLHTAGILSAAITRPDRTIGRKQILTPSAVKQFAIDKKLDYFTPENKDALFVLKDELKVSRFDLAIVADFGMIIPKEIFEIPTHKTINVHFSKLPKLRGASPVQYTILLGDKTAWITLILMDETMDTGDIIWQKEYPLTGTETTRDLYERLFSEIGIELPKIIQEFIDGKVIRVPQDHSLATYTKRLTRDDGFIPWEILKAAREGKKLSQSVILNLFQDPNQMLNQDGYQTVTRQVQHDTKPIIQEVMITTNNYILTIINALRAFFPWPGVWTEIEIKGVKKRLKILRVHLEPSHRPSQGLPLGVASQRSAVRLVLDEVQLEGKNPVPFRQIQI